jgi:hypothetical protein
MKSFRVAAANKVLDAIARLGIPFQDRGYRPVCRIDLGRQVIDNQTKNQGESVKSLIPSHIPSSI